MPKTSYAETVLENLRTFETGHLIDKVRSGSLTPEAHSLAIKVLEQRGHSTEGLPVTPPDDGEPETWMKLSTADLAEKARRRRMFSLPFLLPFLPAFCALVSLAAFYFVKPGHLLGSLVAIGVICAVCFTSISALRRFAFEWGEIPQSERDLRVVASLWVRFAYPAYGISVIAILLAISSIFQ